MVIVVVYLKIIEISIFNLPLRTTFKIFIFRETLFLKKTKTLLLLFTLLEKKSVEVLSM